MNLPLDEHVRRMLLLGKEKIKNTPLLTTEVGSINAKGDNTIGMDVLIESTMIDYVKKNHIPANIFSEEIGIIKFHPDPKYLITFDPLDGSTNYKIGKNIHPYGLLIAVFNGLKPKIDDVITSGAIEYVQNLAWIYKNKKTYDINGKEVSLKEWPIDKSTPIYFDLYYKENYEIYRPFAQKVFIRNTGSTVGNLSYVLFNIAAGLGGASMRPEEIGAVVSLIKGAGGKVVNNKGIDFKEELFSPDKTFQILAGNKKIVEFLVDCLK